MLNHLTLQKMLVLMLILYLRQIAKKKIDSEK